MRPVASIAFESQTSNPIKVAIVDDSVVVRGLFSRWLIEVPGLKVVGTFRSGREIIDNVISIAPDVIILDIEMPDIDGISALPHLIAACPNVTVIVASNLTARNADISLRCLALGAKDYLLKPQTNREVSTSNEFRQLLIEKILTLGGKSKRSPQLRGPVLPTVARAGLSEPAQRPSWNVTNTDLPPMRPFTRTAPKILLIGASTGGPQAVMALLKALKPSLHRLPVLIAQHMPAAFTIMFAEHLSRHAHLDVVQAADREPVLPGRVYVAPGGRHMRLAQSGAAMEISIMDDAPVNFCKPSVDVLMNSASDILGASCLAVILTGMGVDGARGATRVAQYGGNVVVQDEASSVVWGMPGATARTGACAAIMSVPQMVPVLSRLISGENR